MDIEILHKGDFMNELRGEATIRFTYSGVVCFNHAAVIFLKLIESGKKGYSPIHLCKDPKNPGDFGVFKDPSGWVLRKNSTGGAVFNCVGLARYIIDATWNRQGVCHPVSSVKPFSYVFRIARKPWDDGKNKDVFALLRRKE
jgi:hypothetical protein